MTLVQCNGVLVWGLGRRATRQAGHARRRVGLGAGEGRPYRLGLLLLVSTPIGLGNSLGQVWPGVGGLIWAHKKNQKSKIEKETQ